MFFFNYEDPNSHFEVVKCSKQFNGFNYQTLQNIESVDLLNKKTLVILCGNDSNDDIKAARYAYNFFDWIKDNPKAEEIDAYSIFYKNGQPLNSYFSRNPEFNYKSLAKSLFFKLLFAENGDLLPTEEIVKNFSNITFFGHSVGGMVMDELMFNLSNILLSHNVSDNAIRQIFSSIVFVAYSPFELVNHSINCIYITPFYDSVGSTRKAFAKLLSSRNLNSSVSRDELKLAIRRHIHYEEFIKFCLDKTLMETPVVLSTKNTINVSPNLLYYDGIKEDHNLSGITNHRFGEQYKTKEGFETTEFVERVFNYCFNTPRKNFNINDIRGFLEKDGKEKLQQGETNV